MAGNPQRLWRESLSRRWRAWTRLACYSPVPSLCWGIISSPHLPLPPLPPFSYGHDTRCATAFLAALRRAILCRPPVNTRLLLETWTAPAPDTAARISRHTSRRGSRPHLRPGLGRQMLPPDHAARDQFEQ